MKGEEDVAVAGLNSFLQVGWSGTGLRIGRMSIDRVHIHDGVGASHFREFLEAIFRGTRRNRRSRDATRYLEHIPDSEPARLLSLEAADYVADMKRRRLTRTTIFMQRHHFRLLMLATGDIPVSRISSEHIREFWEVQRWWPSNAGSYKRFKTMTDAEILACGRASNRPPPADATTQLAKLQLASFFNNLVKRRVISSSPLVSFGEVKKGFATKARRRGFTPEELQTLFSEENFYPWAKKAPHTWWAPMIGLYTGARVGEIAQLKVSDVFEEHGVMCFHIRVTENKDGGISQSLKGHSAMRVIPVAQQLIDAGFIDFLEDAKEGGHERLFPQLRRGVSRLSGQCNGVSYGQALARIYSAYVKKHLSIDKGLAFHCFRHNLVSGLARAQVRREVIASITGHLPKENGKAPAKFQVMEEFYIDIPVGDMLPDQLVALSGYMPPVLLPRYKRGQFAHCLGPKAKTYP